MKINFYLLASFAVLFVITLFFAILFNKNAKIWVGICLSLYLSLLFIGVFSKIDIVWPNIKVYFNADYGQFCNLKNLNIITLSFSNVAINLSMFIPFGIIIYYLCKTKRLVKTIIFSLSLSILIEILQFLLPINRVTELFDVIFNIISSILGVFICKFAIILQKYFKTKRLN